MFKLIRRLFVRPSVLDLIDDELYEAKVSALEAAKNAESWANLRDTLQQRVQRLEETRKTESSGTLIERTTFRKFQAEA